MKNKLIHFIKSTSIYILVLIPLILSLPIMIAWASLMQSIDPALRNCVSPIVLIIFLGIVSLPGLFQIIKREAPGVPVKLPYSAIWAVVSGVIWVSLCWIIIIGIIVSVIVTL